MTLIEAIKENNEKAFFELLFKTDLSGKRFIDEVDSIDGGGPLYWAATFGHTHFIESLIKAGADVNKADNRGWTPIYVAAYYGRAEIITALKAGGADVDRPDDSGTTPVCAAAYAGSAKAIAALKTAGANVNTPEINGLTPICIAVQQGDLKVIRALLEAGANAAVKTPHGTALELAKQGGPQKDQNIIRLLETHLIQYPKGIKFQLPAKPAQKRHPSVEDFAVPVSIHLSLQESKIEIDNRAGHQARDELHKHYVAQLSLTPKLRQEGFRELIKALGRCKGSEIDTLTKLMNEENFKALLIKAAECLDDEMPAQDELAADCGDTSTTQKRFNQSFDDSLILYLATRLSAVRENERIFCQEMSRLLAEKGYYYQHSFARNAGYPVDALDYSWLAKGSLIVDYYIEGASQIAREYHYQQGITALQAAEEALENLKIALKEGTEDSLNQKKTLFLEQFNLLVEAAKRGLQYSHPRMRPLHQKYHEYFHNPELPGLFSKVVAFKLRHHRREIELLKNECPPLLNRIAVWSQYALENAKVALGTFHAYLDERLSYDTFYNSAKEQTSALVLSLEKNAVEISLETPPDLRALAAELSESHKRLLAIGQDINRSSAALLEKQISTETKTILESILSVIENVLGEAPSAFSILGLDSYSRLEMSFCSAIDFAVLVSDESVAQHPYFKSLMSLWVHLRRALPPGMFNIDGKALQNLFAKESSLVYTPEQMVLTHCPFYPEKEFKDLAERLVNEESYNIRRASLIYNSQTQSVLSQTLYPSYQKALSKQLEAIDAVSLPPYYQRIGQACFRKDFQKQNDTTLLNISLHSRKTLTLWILNAGTYFGIKENNTWAILERLAVESRIAPVFFEELKEALNTLHLFSLRLHYAWLTHPKPPALSLDTWLPMPQAEFDEYVPDFYLDIIERRIIKPLSETVSVFGGTLPLPQFDPVLLYFEQELKALSKLEPEDVKEAHFTILSTLAEIALTRSHLLKPSSTFRDLLPALKLAYLEALEAALQSMERAGVLKETAELKALIKALWHYPTEDGFRAESLRQERAWHEQLMCLISVEVLVSESDTLTTVSLVEDNRIKHYGLKPEIASQLFTTQGAWQPKDAKVEGNHLVYRILNESKTETLCWAKIYPEQPGIEWLMLHLDQRLGVYGIPYSTLVNLHHEGQNIAVLLSAHVPHPNLLTTLEQNPEILSQLDPAHFFKTLIRVLLSNPEDDKGNDYFLEPSTQGLRLIRIDNERGFFAAESSSGLLTKAKLQVKTIIYCLDLLIEPLNRNNSRIDAAIQDFLRLKPYALLKSLLLDLQKLQPLWQQLFSETDVKTHYDNQMPWLSLPLLYVPPALLKELSTRMESLQNLLALHPKISGLELLNTTQHALAEHYKTGFTVYPNQNYAKALARFDLSPGQHYKKESGRTVSMHGAKAVTNSLGLSQKPSLSQVKLIWQGKIYGADDLLKQIERWEQTRTAEVFNGLIHPDPKTQKEARAKWQQLPNRQRALLFNEFSDWVRKSPAANIEMQQHFLSVLPNTTFHSLDLSAFRESLEDKFLISILKSGGVHLTALNLSDCQKLSDSIPGAISTYCPNLKTLSLCNMTWKSFSTGRRGWSPILLPKLERLEMQNCKALEYFITDAPPQADIILEGCTALKHIQFSSDLSFIAATQLRLGEHQYELAKAYSLGTGVSKNLTQAYYWGQLSFEKNHPSASLLCGECAYVVAKSYLLGDGVLKDINQAYHWARLAREHQHPLSEMLCYALFNFYAITPTNGNNESRGTEEAALSLVGKSSLTSIQTLNDNVKTLELGNILENINESGLTLLSFTPAVNNTFTHVNWQYCNKTPDVKAIAEAQANSMLRPDSALEKLLTQCERLAALSLNAVPITTLGKSGLLSASPLILPHLRSLTLQNLDKLTRFLLQTPQLTSLQLVNVSLKQLGDTKAPLILPQLTSLSLEDLPQVTDITLQAPQLRNLEMRHCDALESLETQSEHARTLLDKGIALSTEDPKKAAEQLDSALALEPNHILKLIEIEQSLPQTLAGYISHYLRSNPALPSLTPQFKIAQQLPRKLQEFLGYVVQGEQDKAEVLLQRYPALGLYGGNVTDLSKRSFKNITALQYALWALDWHMWTMLLKYIPPKAAAKQIAQLEQGLWVPQHGVTVNWENLIQALNQYVSEVRSNKPYEVYRQTWIKQVGGAQLLLPAHVINEYCHPTRFFHPTPDFSQPEASGAWRRRTTDEGEWFSAKYGGGTLGEGFAVCRGNNSRAHAVRRLIHCGVAELDSAAVAALFKTRASQRAALVAQYSPQQEPVPKVAQGLNARRS